MTTLTDCLLPLAGRAPLTLERGEGAYVFDSAGRRYLDAITGIGVNALGHGHPRVLVAIAEQASRLLHTSNLFHNPFQDRLAERLCAMTGLDRAFFSSTGTEAVEAALKAVRARRPGGRIIALDDSFHGRTIGSLAVTGRPKYRAPFGPLTPEVTFVEPNDCEALERAFDDGVAGGDVSGIILEPILGEGGIVPLHPGFLRLARELAARHGALLIADEIQCGLGRTGRVFAHEEAGIKPDIVVLAKPLAAGLPLGATLFSEEAAAALPPGAHGTTFGGGPLACRVALEFLDAMEALLPNIRGTGEQLIHGLRALGLEVRGRGLMIGIELGRPGQFAVDRARAHGLLINCTHETVLRLLPPFTLSSGEADEIVETLRLVLQRPDQKRQHEA